MKGNGKSGMSRRRFLGTAAVGAGVAAGLFGGTGSALFPTYGPQPDCTQYDPDLETTLNGFICSGECVPFTETLWGYQVNEAILNGYYLWLSLPENEWLKDYLAWYFLYEQSKPYNKSIEQMIENGEFPVPAGTIYENWTEETHPDYWNNSSGDYYWANYFQLELMRRPSFFADENISYLDDQTDLVEFTVPKGTMDLFKTLYEGGYLTEEDEYRFLTCPPFCPFLPEPLPLKKDESLDWIYAAADQHLTSEQKQIKLRGWYIKGEGLDTIHHPLIIMLNGHTWEMTVTDPGTDPYTASGPFWRNFVFQLAMAGFDILTIDKRGHGVTGGYLSTDSGNNSEDVFCILDQLESGSAYVLDSDGNEVASNTLLPDSAKNTETLLCGGSFGDLAVANAMKKNVGEQRGYNFKAVLSLEGLDAGAGWLTGDPTPFVLMFSVAQFDLDSIYAPTGIFDSMPYWPAFFTAKGTKDELLGPDGAVAAYNQARGLKEIVLVRGNHSMGSWGETGFMYVVRKMIKFAREAALRPTTASLDNVSTTTLRTEICKAPPYDSGIFHSTEILTANRIKKFLRDKCREDGGTWDETSMECILPE